MTELAGFDVIGEVHLDTILGCVNLAKPVTDSLDGKVIYLFAAANCDATLLCGETAQTVPRSIAPCTQGATR